MSDSDTSASDLNCSDLMENSFETSAGGKQLSNAGGSTSKSDNDTYVKKSDPDVQAVINAQILDQLDRIGKRLDNIENKNCKKTADKTKIKKTKVKEQKTKKQSIFGSCNTNIFKFLISAQISI